VQYQVLDELKTRVEEFAFYPKNLKKGEKSESKAMLSDVGGIDLKNIGVEKKSAGAKIRFNDAAMKAILDGGRFGGFTPVFINIRPISSPASILGIIPKKESGVLVEG
jgi:hypothetical protein